MQAESASAARVDDVRGIAAATEHTVSACRMRLRAARFLRQSLDAQLRTTQCELDAALKHKHGAAAAAAAKQLAQVRAHVGRGPGMLCFRRSEDFGAPPEAVKPLVPLA